MAELPVIENKSPQLTTTKESDENKAYFQGYNNGITNAVDAGFALPLVSDREVVELVKKADLSSAPLNEETVAAFEQGYNDALRDIEETYIKTREKSGEGCGLPGYGLESGDKVDESDSEEARLQAVELVERRIDALKAEQDEMHEELERLTVMGKKSIEVKEKTRGKGD